MATRNCPRCGRDFEHKRARICGGCRRPQIPNAPRHLRPLTFRERQVIDRVILGMRNKGIGFELHLSEGTVKQYLNNVFRKTGVKNRTELAVAFARQAM